MTSIWSKSNRLSGKKTSQYQEGTILEGCIVIKCDAEMARKACAALYHTESHWFLLWTIAFLFCYLSQYQTWCRSYGEGVVEKECWIPLPFFLPSQCVAFSLTSIWRSFVTRKPTHPSPLHRQVCSHKLSGSIRKDWKVLSYLSPSSLLRWLSIIIILSCIY